MINKVISKFPQDNIIVLSNMTPNALFHDQGLTVIKDPETGEYERLEQIIDGIDTEIEEKLEEIENAKEKKQKKELKKEIKDFVIIIQQQTVLN